MRILYGYYMVTISNGLTWWIFHVSHLSRLGGRKGSGTELPCGAPSMGIDWNHSEPMDDMRGLYMILPSFIHVMIINQNVFMCIYVYKSNVFMCIYVYRYRYVYIYIRKYNAYIYI